MEQQLVKFGTVYSYITGNSIPKGSKFIKLGKKVVKVEQLDYVNGKAFINECLEVSLNKYLFVEA